MSAQRSVMRIVAAIVAAAEVWTATAVAAPSTGGNPAVSARDGRITLDVSGRPLRDVLAALADALQVTVTTNGARLDERVSATLTDVDAEQALRRLLAGHSYLLIHGGHPTPRSVEVVILRESRAEPPRETAPAVVAPFTRPSLDALTHVALHGPDATERADAIEAMAYEAQAAAPGDRHAGDVLELALHDPDEGVRARALETIKDTQEDVPVPALSRMASADRSPARRAEALALLAERADTAAIPALRRALSDADASVRERARELLDDLHLPPDVSAPARPRSPGPRRPREGR